MIRKARRDDMTAILGIYEAAREYMRSSGNPNQWGNSYPPLRTIEEDLANGELYVLCDDRDVPHAVFAFVTGDDPTYGEIQEGDWSSDEPYGAIHRVASDGTLKGVVAQCMAFCKGLIGHLRIDTHQDNRTMQHVLEKNGFVCCGIVHIADGSPRLAYQYLLEETENK